MSADPLPSRSASDSLPVNSASSSLLPSSSLLTAALLAQETSLSSPFHLSPPSSSFHLLSSSSPNNASPVVSQQHEGPLPTFASRALLLHAKVLRAAINHPTLLSSLDRVDARDFQSVKVPRAALQPEEEGEQMALKHSARAESRSATNNVNGGGGGSAVGFEGGPHHEGAHDDVVAPTVGPLSSGSAGPSDDDSVRISGASGGSRGAPQASRAPFLRMFTSPGSASVFPSSSSGRVGSALGYAGGSSSSSKGLSPSKSPTFNEDVGLAHALIHNRNLEDLADQLFATFVNPSDSAGTDYRWMHNAPSSRVRPSMRHGGSEAALVRSGSNNEQRSESNTTTRQPQSGVGNGISTATVLQEDGDRNVVLLVRRQLAARGGGGVVELLLHVAMLKADPLTTQSSGGEALDGVADDRPFTNRQASFVALVASDADETHLSPAALSSLQQSRISFSKDFEKVRVVRGSETSCLYLVTELYGCCRATLAVSSQYDVENLSEGSRSQLLKQRFKELVRLQKNHERCEEVDEAALRHFVEHTIPNAPPPSDEERALLDRSLSYRAAPSSKPFLRMHGSLTSHKGLQLFSRLDDRDSGAMWGKCFGPVDECQEMLFAWVWNTCSYEHMEAHRRANGESLLRTSVVAASGRTQHLTVEIRVGPGIARRRIAMNMAWFKLEREVCGCNAYAIAFEAVAPNAGRNFNSSGQLSGSSSFARSGMGLTNISKTFVEATTSGIYVFEKVAPMVTKFSILQKLDLCTHIPWITHSQLMNSFKLVSDAQEKFKRLDRMVDKELREVLIPPPISTLSSPDQIQMLERCLDMTHQNVAWSAVPRQSPFVKLMVHHKPPKEGERSIGLGRAECIVDCSSKEAAGYAFAYCSRVRCKNSEVEGNPIRFILTATAPHDDVFVTVKRLKFPFRDREFVAREMCAETDNGHYIVVIESLNKDVVVDYGVNMRRLVRATTRGCFTFEPVGSSQCKVLYYQYLDAGGRVPVWLANSKVALSLKVVDEIRDEFARDDEVDEADRDRLTDILKEEKTSRDHDQEEEQLLERVLAALQFDTMPLANPDHTVTMGLNAFAAKQASSFALRGSSTFSAGPAREWSWKGKTVIDASIEYCGALALSSMSRAIMAAVFADGNVDKRKKLQLTKHCSILREVFEGPGVIQTKSLETVSKIAWKWVSEKAFVVVYESVDHPDFPIDETVQRIQRTALLQLEELDTILGISQTRLTYSETLYGLKSEVTSTIEKFAAKRLEVLRVQKNFFDCSRMMDKRGRDLFMSLCSPNKIDEYVYSAVEEVLVNRGLHIMSSYDSMSSKQKRVKSASPLTTTSIAYVPGENLVWGKATTDVRASIEEVLAFFWGTKARNQLKPDTVEKIYIDEPNNHNRLEYVVKKPPRGFNISARDFCNRYVWKYIDRESLILIAEPSDERPPAKNLVRGRSRCIWKFKKLGSKESSVEFAVQVDFGGEVVLPNFVKEYYNTFNLRRLTASQQYFQELRPIQYYDRVDGIAVGEAIMLQSRGGERSGASRNQVRIKAVVNRHVGLKEFASKNNWFPFLVEGMLDQYIRDSVVVNTRLDNLSSKEARTIGESFSLALYDRQIGEDGVELWVNDYSSLVEFSKRHAFFVPMSIVIGQRQLKSAPWGLILKVALGVFLSFLDIATDLNSILQLRNQGKTDFSNAVAACIILATFLQVLLVRGIYKRRGPKFVAREILIILSGFKPAVDAYRVVGGTKRHKDDKLEVEQVVLVSKILQIVVESIPSSLIQVYAFLVLWPSKIGGSNWQSILSICSSFLTTSYVAMTLSFDVDLSPASRTENPLFYGYVPNSLNRRTLVAATMFFFTLCHVCSRLSGVALLAVANPTYAAWILGADMFQFMFVKILRDDFRHPINVPGVMSWVFSFFFRVGQKAFSDYACFVQMRIGMALGGFYWTLNLVIGHSLSFVSVYLFCLARRAEQEPDEANILWIFFSSLSIGFLFFFLFFLALINRKYLATFTDTRNFKDIVASKFHEVTSDQTRISIFRMHPAIYYGIREDIKEWLQNNYHRWLEEKPDWSMTERGKIQILSIPLDFLPLGSDGERSTGPGQ